MLYHYNLKALSYYFDVHALDSICSNRKYLKLAITSNSLQQASSSMDMMYIGCLLLPNLATDWAFQEKVEDTDGIPSVLEPPPVGCRY